MEYITEYRNLRKIVHKLYCDKCGIEMESMNIVYATYPPQYPYICPQCNEQITTQQNYPWTELVGDEVQIGPNKERVCISI